jgi:hypothetical protein
MGKMAGRYRTVLHAYVLMGNHYQLLLEMPEANLSAAQWFNVSMGVLKGPSDFGRGELPGPNPSPVEG